MQPEPSVEQREHDIVQRNERPPRRPPVWRRRSWGTLAFWSFVIGILGLLLAIPPAMRDVGGWLRPGSEDTTLRRPPQGIGTSPPQMQRTGAGIQLQQVATFLAHSGEVKPSEPGVGRSVAISSDNMVVATGGRDRMVRLWNAATGAKLAELGDHKDDVTSVVFHPTRAVLASGSWDQTVRLWDVAIATRPTLITTIETRNHGDVTALAFSPDGRVLAIAGGWWVEIFDVSALPTVHHVRDLFVGSNTGVELAAFSPDGTTVIAGGQRQESYEGWLFEVATGRRIADLRGHRSYVRSVGFVNNTAAVTTSFDRFIRFWSVPEGTLVDELDAGAGVNSVAVRHDGTLMAFAEGSDVVIRDVTRHKEVARVAAAAYEAWSVAFSPNGRTLAAIWRDGTLGIWTIP
jgi:WD40 repeat protein